MRAARPCWTTSWRARAASTATSSGWSTGPASAERQRAPPRFRRAAADRRGDRRDRRLAQAARARMPLLAGADHRPFRMPRSLHDPGARAAGAASAMKTRRPEFYRPNVGLMLIGPERRIFVGRRLNQPDAWQMPQGGVDKGETPVEAACRELREEVGTAKALLLRETRDWVTYDVPAELRPPTGRAAGAARRRNGSRSPSPAATPTSTSPPTIRNSTPGAGRRQANCSRRSCPGSARSTRSC